MPICPKCREENPQLGAKCPRDGHYFIPKESVKDAQTDPLIGTIAADKYVILGMISEGGMGAVYRALQLPVEREVALKVLRTELQESDQGKERFIVEARAVGRLNHPNIITLHDYGIDTNNHPYMVMEYAPGQSLARWLRGDIDMDRIVHVMEQVLSALSEAHDRGIVHRDLKPENMIVTKAGTDHDYIKLLDFGIARMINEGATRKLTREGEVFGTPHYMAPEQAQGRRNVGPPADVYACGIIMWELITGQCPFDAPTPLAVLFMHINEDLPKLEPRLGMNVPQEVRDVLTKATKKDSLARYQHAGEMLEALRHSVNKYITRTTLSGSRRPRTEQEPEPEPVVEKPKPSAADRSAPLSLASRASRDTSDSGIVAFDPDPSLERPALDRPEPKPKPEPTMAPEPAKTEYNEKGEKAKLRLSLVAVSILAVFAVVVAIVAMASDGEAPEAEAAENAIAEGAESDAVSPKADTTAAETAKNEVAAAKEKPEPAPVADDARPEEGLPTGTVPVDPRTVAGHAPPNLGRPAAAGEETATPEEKVEPKTVEPKTVEPKKVVAKKVEPKKAEPKKVEPKKTTEDEPKKFEPRTFTDPPPTKWK